MYSIRLNDFDMEQIALSGQCFRINKDENGKWVVPAFGRRLSVSQNKTLFEFDCSKDEFYKIWYNYFDLQTDYSKVKDIILDSGDKYLIEAVKFGYGIRILRQDVWEMVVSYIISQRNSITRIKNTIEKLCASFGGNFPTAEDLSQYTLQDFQRLGLGYRAKFIMNAVRSVISGQLVLNELSKMNYTDSIKYLKQFNGVGDKVANCIALFGLHKTEAFPIDVWIQKIIDTQYDGRFDYTKFGNYAGIVQQYMFFYERMK